MSTTTKPAEVNPATPAAKRKARAQRIRELMQDEGYSRREASALADAGF